MNGDRGVSIGFGEAWRVIGKKMAGDAGNTSHVHIRTRVYITGDIPPPPITRALRKIARDPRHSRELRREFAAHVRFPPAFLLVFFLSTPSTLFHFLSDSYAVYPLPRITESALSSF